MQSRWIGAGAVLGVLSLAAAAHAAPAEAGDKAAEGARKAPAPGADDAAEVRFISAPGSPEKVKYLGSAPYICTPSGYGERAKCFLRPSGARTRAR
jgi:hypothetical protein